MEIDLGLLVVPKPGRPSPGPQRDSLFHHDIRGFVLVNRGGAVLRQSLQAAAPAISRLTEVRKDMSALWPSKVVTWPYSGAV